MRFTRESAFGQVTDDFAMDNVECNGNEESIQDCTYLPEDNCGPGEGAGVVCNNAHISSSTSSSQISIWLEGGSGPHEGNIMVRMPNGRTGPVCDDTFNDEGENDLGKVIYLHSSMRLYFV